MAALSGSLGLPASWHKADDGTTLSRLHAVECDGFKVVAGLDEGPYVELHDTAAIQALLRRLAGAYFNQSTAVTANYWLTPRAVRL